MKKIKIVDLSLSQLTYAVGLAETAKGIYSMDPLEAGLPKNFTARVYAQQNFKDHYEGINVSQVAPFLQDLNGVLYLYGPGEWMVGTFNTDTGKPHISHGCGGKFTPLKNGVDILEREKITTTPGRREWRSDCNVQAPEGWTAWSIHNEDDESEGETLLEAGLRCYVHSVYGDYVDLPDNVM